MNTRTIYRWAVAPRFHLPIDWPRRLLLSDGVERREGLFFPRLPWRPPTPEELARLTVPPGAPPIDPERALSLFGLPRHLMRGWSDLLTQELGGDRRDGFARFASEVCDFLTFKGLEVSAGAVDLVVCAAGQAATHWDGEGRHGAGLGLSLPSWVWGVINLGEEPASLVAVAATPDEMRAALPDHSPEEEMARRFLACRSEQPVVRLSLARGEGVRLPAAGLIVGGCTLGCDGPDVLLLLRQVTRPSRPDRGTGRRAVPLPVRMRTPPRSDPSADRPLQPPPDLRFRLEADQAVHLPAALQDQQGGDAVGPEP
jgi:hypothetical protein